MQDLLAQIPAITPTPTLALVGLALAVAAVLLFLLAPPRYVRQKTLFSPAELAFLRALEGAVGANDRIFAKVA